MELVKDTQEANLGMDSKGVVHSSGLEKELEEFRIKYTQLEERCKKAEDKCTSLELEIQKKNSYVEGSKDEEEDKVLQLMIENEVLECEKKRAESDAEVWKLKSGELESRILELEMENLTLRTELKLLSTPKPHLVMNGEDTNIARNSNHGLDVVASSDQLKAENRRAGATMSSGQLIRKSTRVKRKLPFVEEGNPIKKLAPSTPAGAGFSVGVIDIEDSDDELLNPNTSTLLSEAQRNRVDRVSFDVGDQKKKPSDHDLNETLPDQSDDDDFNDVKGKSPFVRTPKSRIASQRKRGSNIITSDSEEDDDDDLPICKLKTKYLKERSNIPGNALLENSDLEDDIRESATPRRRLVRLRNCNVKNLPEASPSSDNYPCETPINGDIDNDGEESEYEGESLGGFIVSSSESSDGDDDEVSASHDVSDDNVDFGEVLSRIRREKDHRVKWKFEADMLAAFGKDIELCMKAVCAIYRRQTEDEQSGKQTIHLNGEGFSQCDAPRGSALAEFLCSGGDRMKSVEELREYDPAGPELCRTLAIRYSRQLFAIYNDEEDDSFSFNMTWPASGANN